MQTPADVVRDGFVLFWKPPSVFGQWTPSAFEVKGQRCCALPPASWPLSALLLALRLSHLFARRAVP